MLETEVLLIQYLFIRVQACNESLSDRRNSVPLCREPVDSSSSVACLVRRAVLELEYQSTFVAFAFLRPVSEDSFSKLLLLDGPRPMICDLPLS